MAKNRLYGLGEPLTQRILNGEIEREPAFAILDRLNVGAFREWMHIPLLLKDPQTPNEPMVAAYTETLDRMAAMDIEVTGMSHCWFLPDGTTSHGDMLARDLTPGSDYRKILDMYEQSWYTLVSCFPQVPQWEVGNECDIDIFLHPVGWRPGKPRFSHDEKMDIATEMMFRAAQGIRRANPRAKVVSFSPTAGAPSMSEGMPYFVPQQYGIALAFEKVYQRIESGEFGSDKSDDFFDLLAWHPYIPTQMTYAPILTDYPATKFYLREEFPDHLWRSYNDAVYNVMVRHGDGHKQGLITEFGFSDKGDPVWEQRQAQMWAQAFDTAREMPYLRTLHTFRMFEQATMGEENVPGTISGRAEIYFGIYHEKSQNYAPRNKALVLEKEFRK